MGQGFYVRHGHVGPGVPGDVPLSALGREQAARAAAWLGAHDVDVVVTSPLLRARETAEAIGAALGVGVVVDGRLRERMNWGDVAGQSFEQFCRLWDETAVDRDRVPHPGAPTAREAGERLRLVMLDRVGVCPVLVAHGGLLQCLHDTIEEGRTAAPAARLRVPHCSVTTFEVVDDEVRLLSVGRVPG